MRWFSISVDADDPIHVAASDLVGAVIWVWDNVSKDARSITIHELVDEPPLDPAIKEALNARRN